MNRRCVNGLRFMRSLFYMKKEGEFASLVISSSCRILEVEEYNIYNCPRIKTDVKQVPCWYGKAGGCFSLRMYEIILQVYLQNLGRSDKLSIKLKERTICPERRRYDDYYD